MAGETVQAPSQMNTLLGLMQLMNQGRGAAGGQTANIDSTTTTSGGGGTESMTGYSSPGDISALQALLGELGGANYQGVLESIFSQAGGKIPGFMQAFQNSAGARSGSNSAVNATLQRLLQDTTLQGQAQMADLGLKNATIRQNIGANIAQATKGTHTRQSVSRSVAPQVSRQVQTNTAVPTKEAYDGTDMLKLMAALSLGQKGWDLAKGKFGEMTKGGADSPTADAGGVAGGQITSAANPSLYSLTSDSPLTSSAYAPSFQLGQDSMSQLNAQGQPTQWTLPAFGGNSPAFGGFDYSPNFGGISSNTDWSANYNLDSGSDGFGLSAPNFQWSDIGDVMGGVDYSLSSGGSDWGNLSAGDLDANDFFNY